MTFLLLCVDFLANWIYYKIKEVTKMSNFFIKDKLTIICHEYSYDNPETNTQNTIVDVKYVVFALMRGSAYVYIDGESIIANEGDMLIIDRSVPFGYRFKGAIPSLALVLRIHPNIIPDSDDTDFFRSFHYFSQNRQFIKFRERPFENCESILKMILNRIEKNYCLIHHLGCVTSLISELNICYDENINPNFELETDNISVKVINYVDHHYTEKVTYEMLSEIYFVSHTTITRIFKWYFNQTLHEYIEQKRMEDAKRCVENLGVIHLTAKGISSICGYKNYPTFCRAYKRYFGTNLTDDIRACADKQHRTSPLPSNQPFSTN